MGEQMLLRRSYVIDDATVAGRTLHVRIVPYASPAVVADPADDTRAGTSTRPYREAWERGAFRHAVKAAHRVPLIVGRHTDRQSNPFADVGRGLTFAEKDDALYGDLAVDSSPFGDHALAKVDSGQWRGISVGARGLRFRDHADPHAGGLRWRTLAALDHVLLTEHPAYTDAQVLAVREALNQPSDKPLLDKWVAKYRTHVSS